MNVSAYIVCTSNHVVTDHKSVVKRKDVIYYTHVIKKAASHLLSRRPFWCSRCNNWLHQIVEEKHGEAAYGNEKEIGVEPDLFNWKSDREGFSPSGAGAFVGQAVTTTMVNCLAF